MVTKEKELENEMNEIEKVLPWSWNNKYSDLEKVDFIEVFKRGIRQGRLTQIEDEIKWLEENLYKLKDKLTGYIYAIEKNRVEDRTKKLKGELKND